MIFELRYRLRWCLDGLYKHEKMLNIISCYRNADQKHNEIPLQTYSMAETKKTDHKKVGKDMNELEIQKLLVGI